MSCRLVLFLLLEAFWSVIIVNGGICCAKLSSCCLSAEVPPESWLGEDFARLAVYSPEKWEKMWAEVSSSNRSKLTKETITAYKALQRQADQHRRQVDSWDDERFQYMGRLKSKPNLGKVITALDGVLEVNDQLMVAVERVVSVCYGEGGARENCARLRETSDHKLEQLKKAVLELDQVRALAGIEAPKVSGMSLGKVVNGLLGYGLPFAFGVGISTVLHQFMAYGYTLGPVLISGDDGDAGATWKLPTVVPKSTTFDDWDGPFFLFRGYNFIIFAAALLIFICVCIPLCCLVKCRRSDAPAATKMADSVKDKDTTSTTKESHRG